MDFARKQMEKFGWKEGSGLGKDNQGMLQAIKPNLKVGKEGMGYDFSKELVDTWWTRAYDDSLNRINVEDNADGQANDTVGVSLKEDEDPKKADGSLTSTTEERPFEKMKKRMMKATFTTFSKGATLSNGEMIVESTKLESDSDSDSSIKKQKTTKALTDEELFLACGGRTAHKAARFGLKLNGKLARIAAQEEAAKALISNLKIAQKVQKPVSECPSSSSPSQEEPAAVTSKPVKDKKKKKKSKHDPEEVSVTHIHEKEEGSANHSNNGAVHQDLLDEHDPNLRESEKGKKKKKHKRRKYTELDEPNTSDMSSSQTTNLNKETEAESEEILNESVKKVHKKNKKSKKRKLCENDEALGLLSD